MKTIVESDPVVPELIRANAGRKPRLLRIKFRRMAADAFSFFRGADPLFAGDWDEVKPDDEGPRIWICGDLHLENFGAYRTEGGDFRFDINDFDEAIVGPCALDLVRCSASIFLAAELWGLKPTEATGMALSYLDHYRDAIRSGVPDEVSPTSGHGAIWDLLSATAAGSQASLLDRVTRRKRNGRRMLRASWNHPEVGHRRARVVREVLTDHLKHRPDGEHLRVLDLTGRIAGVGSLGVRRYLALVGDGTHHEADRVIDVKECGPPATSVIVDGQQPAFIDDAHRVTYAQGLLQGHSGLGLGTLAIDDRSYRVREMIPDENRASLDRLRRRPDRLREAVAVAGKLTAWSQLRGARLPGGDRTADLERWARGPAPAAILASAARVADRTNRDFSAFRLAETAGRIDPRSADP
jgi:uncharacterized protein (DUF2252 family)